MLATIPCSGVRIMCLACAVLLAHPVLDARCSLVREGSRLTACLLCLHLQPRQARSGARSRFPCPYTEQYIDCASVKHLRHCWSPCIA